MIRKFALVPRLSIVPCAVLLAMLAGIPNVLAQQPSTEQTAQPQAQPQQPDQSQSQQPAPSPSQEATQEETENAPRKKVKDYKNWTFNAGGGINLPNGTTRSFVREGSGALAAGVARNYGKYFGLRLDFQWDNLPLRNSALGLAQAPSATSHVYSFMLDPIFNIPVTQNWGGYVVIGPAFYHRSGKLDSSNAVPGSACNSFYNWWGTCYAGSLPLSGRFLSASQNEFGENFGGGVTRKISPKMEIYLDIRYLHGAHNGRTTDLRPITLGLRW